MNNAQTLAEFQQVLANLKDIHYPDTPLIWPLSEALWWPPAPGVLIILLVISAFSLIILNKIFSYINSKYKNRVIKIALRELEKIDNEMIEGKSQSPIVISQKISVLLKKCALSKYGTHYKDKSIKDKHTIKNKNNKEIIYIPSLSGNQWLEFLNHTGNTSEFTTETGKLITNLPYLKELPENKILDQDLKQLVKISKQWIKENL